MIELKSSGAGGSPLTRSIAPAAGESEMARIMKGVTTR